MTRCSNLFIDLRCSVSVSIILVAVGVDFTLLFLDIQEAAVSVSPVLEMNE